MSSLGKLVPAMNQRIAVALAFVALAASPALAAPRHAPHAVGGAPGAGQAKPGGGDASGPLDKAPKGPAEHGGTAADGKVVGGKAGDGKAADGKPVGPIDLTRPDDGYGNQRRRTARPLFITTHAKPPVGAPATIALPHPPAITTLDQSRNAAGAAVPAAPVLPAVAGSARSEPTHFESTALGVKNNLGLGGATVHPAPVHIATTPAPPKPPVIGINGSTIHPSSSGIGGPAKDHSAITGSSYKHK